MRGFNLPLANRGLMFLVDVSFDSLNAGTFLIDDVIFPADCCLCKADALALSTSIRCPSVIVSSGGDSIHGDMICIECKSRNKRRDTMSRNKYGPMANKALQSNIHLSKKRQGVSPVGTTV